MEEWNNGNDFFHGATLLATNAHRPILLRTQITTAYSNQISVPADECGHLIVLPLSQRLLHSPLAMTAWLVNLSCTGQLSTPHIPNTTRQTPPGHNPKITYPLHNPSSFIFTRLSSPSDRTGRFAPRCDPTNSTL